MSVEVPPLEVIARTLPHLVAFLGRLGSTEVGPSLRLSSWYRDAETNRRVGGHPRSQHLLGLALDVVGDRIELLAFLEQVRLVGLIGIDEESHVHVQYFPAGRAEYLLDV